jgi:hypothetical protein
VAEDFLGLLRSLHEEAKRREIWQNLRLVVVHSTECDRLHRYWWMLERESGLIEAMREVAVASEPVLLPSPQAFKLNSLGLVKLEGSLCTPRCRLFRDYFKNSQSSIITTSD